jgi:hypothetical protein
MDRRSSHRRSSRRRSFQRLSFQSLCTDRALRILRQICSARLVTLHLRWSGKWSGSPSNGVLYFTLTHLIYSCTKTSVCSN